MSNRYVADTMALILYLEKRKLSKAVLKIFTEVENNNAELIIPAMVLAEVAYLSERKRIDTHVSDVKKLLANFKNVRVAAMDLSTVEAAFDISSIPELHDRLITATAIVSKATLLTNDPVIIHSKTIKVVW